jgi:hypothetical protein
VKLETDLRLQLQLCRRLTSKKNETDCRSPEKAAGFSRFRPEKTPGRALKLRASAAKSLIFGVVLASRPLGYIFNLWLVGKQ